MSPELLILDLDRTLVDVQTYTNYEAACEDLKKALGEVALDLMPVSGWRSATQKAMAILFALASDEERWEVADRIISGHETAAVPKARAMPHVHEFVAATSRLPRAVVTLMGQAPAEAALAAFGLDVRPVLGRVAGMTPKPEPDSLNRALALFDQTPGGAVMVGDSPWDSEASEAAGVGFVGVLNGRHSVFPAHLKVVETLADVQAELGL